MKAIINARIYDYNNFHNNYFIVYDQKIQKIGPMAFFSNGEYDEIIDAKNGLVIPGFACSHTHLYSSFARGMSIPFNPKSFKDVLKQMWWKLDHFLDNDILYYSALSGGLDQLVKGSTTLIDHHASFNIKGSLDTIKKALVDDLGIRAILAFETSDRFDIDESIRENAEFIKKNKSDKISGLFGLHASFTLSDETLKKVSENLNNAGIHIHVAESIKDEEDSINNYGKSVVKRLEDFNLINDNSILVHCTNASEKELDIIKKHNAYIAVNTTSNMNNAVGLPNVKMMEEKKINLMIGNDGLIQSMPIEYLNAYYSAHLNSKNPIGLSIDTIKKAILTSYEFVEKQLGVKIGMIKNGYVSDLLIIPYKEFTPLNKDNIFGHLFFGIFPGFLPKYVIAGGKTIVDNYHVNETIENKLNEATDKATKLWKTIDKEGNTLEFKF